MKQPVLIPLSLFLFSGCQTSDFTGDVDKEWNVSFYSNCQLPQNAISTIEENGNKFLRFKLENMQKGGCSSDREPRHGAPYWERAELKQSTFLDTNSIYEIKFKVRFLEGFTGKRETFFQIHQSVPGCRTGPPTMLKFSTNRLRLDAKRDPEHHANYYSNIKLDELYNKWSRIKFKYDGKNKIINVFLNSDLIFRDITFVPLPCGRPHIKFGIYRPGSKYTPNNTSKVDFDDVEVKKIK